MNVVKTKQVCGGKPRLKGTRITVESILFGVASGISMNNIIKNLNSAGANISKNEIFDVLKYAAMRVNAKK